MTELRENSISNSIENNKNNDNFNIPKEEKNKTRKDKKDYLDFKIAFNKLKKFLQKKNLMFLCKRCNNYLCSNYSLEDVLVLSNNKINFIFKIESILEEANKDFDKDNLTLKNVFNFFLTERNILISEKIEFSKTESNYLDFIYYKILCKNCDEVIGKFVIGAPLKLLKFKNKIFLFEDKLTVIKKEKDSLPEKVNFNEFMLNDLAYQNIINETNKQFDNAQDAMFNFSVYC